MSSMAPVLAITKMVAVLSLKKDSGPTPLERLCGFADRAEPC